MNTIKLVTTLLLLILSSYSFGQFGGLIKKPKKPKEQKKGKSKAEQEKIKRQTVNGSCTWVFRTEMRPVSGPQLCRSLTQTQ